MRKPSNNDTCDPREFVQLYSKNKDLQVQLVLSLLLGISALLAFCILRPRWPSLYAARKRRLDPEIGPPPLSNSFVGWIRGLYKVTQGEILASAGLDAFVFLTFFKMAIRLFAVMAFFAVAVLLPINHYCRDYWPNFNGGVDPGDGDTGDMFNLFNSSAQLPLGADFAILEHDTPVDKSSERTYLWAYVVFTYLFVAMTLYSINWETFRIIQIRQDYLGSQSTVTDRTFRLTGIPLSIRSEDRVKQLIEKLDIGLVDTVTMCRDWKEIDGLMEERDLVLRKFEASWAKYLSNQEAQKKKTPPAQPRETPRDPVAGETSRQDVDEESGENGQLLSESAAAQDDSEALRPPVIIRFGAFGLRTRKLDALDYYEEKLRRLDEKIGEARKKEYEATDMALVTMDSVASCQMLIQARIDPRPGRLLTKSTPSPSDLVWKNTYSPRGVRRLKSWGVTIFITVLTLVWIFPTAFLASLVSICTIRQVTPSFAAWLSEHSIFNSLFQTGLPTLAVSLLNVAVPYVYDWLSNRQGMISRGDVELSVISKNFFFIFFNTFFVFAVSTTGIDFWSTLRDYLKDTSQIPGAIAHDVERLSVFYISYIMLQGIGLMPFRMLEVGSVFTYPFYRMSSTTPRDFSELQKPATFQYGFYLPTALLVFNLCLVYSILLNGFFILIFGTIYFALGYFTFKYMVLYAMDQPQHATGGAWRIICYRIVVGLLVFEVVMIGQIASLRAFVQSVTILPLIPFTIWYSYYFKRRFEPLTRYIALRAITSDHDTEGSEASDDAFEGGGAPRPSQGLLRRGSTLDEHREKGLTFVNPNLVVPLQRPWLYQDPPPSMPTDETETEDERPPLVLANPDSSLGIGDDNVWSEGRGSGV